MIYCISTQCSGSVTGGSNAQNILSIQVRQQESAAEAGILSPSPAGDAMIKYD